MLWCWFAVVHHHNLYISDAVTLSEHGAHKQSFHKLSWHCRTEALTLFLLVNKMAYNLEQRIHKHKEHFDWQNTQLQPHESSLRQKWQR